MSTPSSELTFSTLNLNPLLLKAVETAGYQHPTPVQAEAIPLVLAGHDLMVRSSTGSGKTAAFMLPALHKLAEPSPVRGVGPRVLVLTPTRELALQVAKVSETYARVFKRMNIVCVVGGVSYTMQLKQLKQPVDVLIATPGRLLDHMERGRINFSRMEVLVLDEADRMLDMGFLEDIEAIMKALPKKRQTLMFSATFDGAVSTLAQNLLNNPQKVEIAAAQASARNIEQRLHYADNLQHKNRLLAAILNDKNLTQAIVFTATKRDADTLADTLADNGVMAASLHGDMKQSQRNRTLTNLRRGQLRVLVATDVAARGIDVPTISHVINYDLPRQAEDYVHRIGRTGRAGRAGIAISLVNVKEHLGVKRIERFTNQQIPVCVLPGLEPTQPLQHKPSAGKKHSHGKRSYGGGRNFSNAKDGPKPHRFSRSSKNDRGATQGKRGFHPI